MMALLVCLAAVAVWASRGRGAEAAGARGQAVNVGAPAGDGRSSPADPLAQARACQANLKSIATALEMYATDHSGHYPDSMSSLRPIYLKEPLICPAAGSDTYRYESGMNAAHNAVNWADYYYVHCSGGHHAGAHIAGDLPAISCDAGLAPELPFEGSSQDARAACEGNLKNLATALEMYSVDNGGHYPDSFQQLIPNYIREMPHCPSSGTDTYTPTLRTGPKAPENEERFPEFYSFHCAGTHEGGPSPGYNSVKGLVAKP